jgi:EAL domain-containing protein (putative c-di-GMP-specific phosphodiesterase class I)
VITVYIVSGECGQGRQRFHEIASAALADTVRLCGAGDRAVKHRREEVDFQIAMPVHRFVKEGAAGLREQPGGEELPPLGPSPEGAEGEAWDRAAAEEWAAEAGKTASGEELARQLIPEEPPDTSLAMPVKTLQGIAVSFPNLEGLRPVVFETRAAPQDAQLAATDAQPAATDAQPAASDAPPAGIETPPAMETPPATERPPGAVEMLPEAMEMLPAAMETLPAAMEMLPAAMEMLPPAIEAPPIVDEAPPPAMESLPPAVEVPPVETPLAADAETWKEAAEEWGDGRRGVPATISSLAWAPPTAVFQRAVDEMWIAWQPIVDWTMRALHGYEALLRTTDALLSRPRLLVEAAGRIGRLPELGRKARKLTAETAGDAPDGSLLFVNLHPRELLDDRLCAGEDELAPHAHKCVLEITERVALDDIPEARARIQQLRLVGYNIAVGSIGSGFAGLASLAELEPDIVKLDQALIRNIHNEPVRRRLVGAMLAACKDLRMAAVAEGVETTGERDALADLGCSLMQGFLFGTPGRGFPGPRW